MEKKQINTGNNLPGQDFQIKDFLFLCLSNWYWFVISVLFCVGVAAFKIVRTPKVYTRSAKVLIKETNVRRQANDMEAMFSAGGFSQMNSKITNEITVFKSPDLMAEVVDRLHLNVTYYAQGRMKKHVMYGSACPIVVDFIPPFAPTSFTVSPSGPKFKVTFASQDESGADAEYETNPGDTLTTGSGAFSINYNPVYKSDFVTPVIVQYVSKAAAVASFSSRVRVEPEDLKNMSDVLNITISDQNTQKADDVILSMVEVYNNNWVADRNKMAVSTSLFITDRLALLENELNSVDENISNYKSRNLMPDAGAVSSMYVSKTNRIDAEKQQLGNELYLTKYLRSYLDGIKPDQLIPLPSGISGSGVSNQIIRYNELVIERNSLLFGSSAQNPLVVEADNNLAALRTLIVESVDNQVNAIQAQIEGLTSQERVANSKLADNPGQAMHLLSIERQQKVKESLYLYLLQKREENELSQAFTAYNTRIITKPYGSSSPTSPQTAKILLIALMLGFGIPVCVLYLKDVLNTKIRGRKDLESLTMPFLGEIPFFSSQTSNFFSRKKDVIIPPVVEKGKRDTINEAYRVLRTNLEFMCRRNNDKIFTVTSYNPGSGKTFTTVNLAAALSLRGFKVVIIDGDLRHASLSNFVANKKKGVADYLVGDVKDFHDVISHLEKSEEVAAIPVGTLPPNPSELVADKRFGELIAQLKSEYDYVFIDCPPVDIVADTQIIEQYADMTIFIIRSGLLERSMLVDLENIYQQQKFKNMALLLNGTIDVETRYRYGSYRYGYRYGYGYSHHYGYGSDKK